MTVQHIVLVEWKDEADQATIDAFVAAVSAFPEKIDGVEKVEFGKNISERAGNYTHVGIVTMRDRDVLAVYGPHPEHQAALAGAMPVVENILVADLET